MQNISRFTILFNERQTNTVLVKTPTKDYINIVCDLCHCVLVQDYYTNGAEMRFYDMEIEDQLNKRFVSVSKDHMSIQYCCTCAQVIQVAPL